MTYQAHPQTQIGHVHLRVSDLEKSVAFYRDVLGLDVVSRYGANAAFLSAGGYHHHLGLNTWSSAGGNPASDRQPGLYHAAFLYPTRAALAAALKAVIDAGIPVTGAADHGVSEAIYFDDPDRNGIEIYWDRDKSEWPRDTKGALKLSNSALDLDNLLAELEKDA